MVCIALAVKRRVAGNESEFVVSSGAGRLRSSYARFLFAAREVNIVLPSPSLSPRDANGPQLVGSGFHIRTFSPLHALSLSHSTTTNVGSVNLPSC